MLLDFPEFPVVLDVQPPGPCVLGRVVQGVLSMMLVGVRVRERLSAPPGHVIGQGPAPGGGVVPCGGGGGRGECIFLRYYGRFLTCKSC